MTALSKVERDLEICRLYVSGLSLHTIGKKLGWNYATVRKALVRAGVARRSRGHPPKKVPGPREMAMRTLYQQGSTYEEIGKRYGVTRERVRQILKKFFDIAGGDGGAHMRSTLKADQVKRDRDGRLLARFGIYAPIRAELIANGATRAYIEQLRNAEGRGVAFNLSFSDFWGIWSASGKWAERGRRGPQYCMARVSDAGPYEVGNVYITTCSENARAARLNNPSVLRAPELRGVWHLYPGRPSGWVAKINRKFLGCFKSAEEAYAARRAALKLAA